MKLKSFSSKAFGMIQGGAHYLEFSLCFLHFCISTMNGGQKRSLRDGGKKVQELREELDRRHHQAKSNHLKDGVAGAGGGVSLWPAMDDMRLSREEMWKLAGLCVALVIGTWAIFHFYHGEKTSVSYALPWRQSADQTWRIYTQALRSQN